MGAACGTPDDPNEIGDVIVTFTDRKFKTVDGESTHVLVQYEHDFVINHINSGAFMKVVEDQNDNGCVCLDNVCNEFKRVEKFKQMFDMEDEDDSVRNLFMHKKLQHKSGKGLDYDKMLVISMLYCDDNSNDKGTILLNYL